MIAFFCLLGCVLAPEQLPQRPNPALPAPTADASVRGSLWTVSPQLNRGQELVYRGEFREEAQGSQVQFNRSYRLEVRVFVLESSPAGYETALLTVLKARNNPLPGTRPGFSENSPSSARMELLRLDAQGKLTHVEEDGGGRRRSPPTPTLPGLSLNAPLEGAPTLECGPFVPAPKERVGIEQDWQVSETNRPPRSWRIVGSEMVNGSSCLKLVGTQQSDDWDQPRADHTAWRRLDSVWMVSRLGYASRVERVIELREPGRREPTQRSVLRYDLESNLSYPGALFEIRRQEITQAQAFAEMAAPLLPTPQRYGPQINYLLNKIRNHLDNQAATPYREAVLQVKRRVEAAQRGETPPMVRPEAVEERPSVATVGLPAPDFITSQFTDTQTARLRAFQGRSVLLVFYNPASETAEELLTYAQKLANNQGDRLTILPLSVSDDPEPALQQRKSLNLTLPVLSGSGLRISYEVETTPKMILLDANGIVRGSYLGWGRETPVEIAEELKRWPAARTPIAPAPAQERR